MKRVAWPFAILFGLLLLLMVGPTTAWGQNKELLVKVTKDGKETSIYQKLITNKRTLVHDEPRDGAHIKRISAFNIFHRLKTDAGQTEQGGFYRIGDRHGKHLGWVLPEDVVEWNTRFVVRPKMVTEKITFKVDVTGDGEANFLWNVNETPGDASAFSFITGPSTSAEPDSEDVGPFPVCFCVARIDNKGTLDQLNQLGEMKLEIVFAIEGAGYLGTKYDGEKPFIDYLNDLAQNYVDLVRSENEADIPVRFGLVGFQDASSNYKYRTPQVLQPLTDDLGQWKSKVATISYPKENADIITDTPNDGASAVYKSLSTDLGWTSNSSKHLVLVGHNPFQVHGKMRGGKPPKRSPLDFLYDRSHSVNNSSEAAWLEKFGYNTSGKSIDDLLNLARPTAGTVENQMRLQKHIHTLHVGQTVRQLFGDEIMDSMDEVNEAVDKVARENGEGALLDVLVDWIDTQPALFTAVVIAQKIGQLDAWDPMAESNYRTLGQDGYNTHMNPDAQDVVRATRELQDEVNEAIKVISDVATGKEKESEANRKTTEFTKPLFKMINADKLKGKDIKKPVWQGDAFLRDENTGRKVGEKLIMVDREELTRLKGTFNSLYEQFNQKRNRADRQDVNGILNDLKESLAQAATGQELDANVNLVDLITDLPLRTEALKLNAGDIAVMSTEGFDEWLEELTTAVERVDTLLENSGSWIVISSLAPSGQQYAFLRLSQLP